jgi:hypothetical protein
MDPAVTRASRRSAATSVATSAVAQEWDTAVEDHVYPTAAAAEVVVAAAEEGVDEAAAVAVDATV